MQKELVLIGYGGHGLVAADIFKLQQYAIAGYCDNEEKQNNPYNIVYLGSENDFLQTPAFRANEQELFVSIGNNAIREKVFNVIAPYTIANAIHPTSVISGSVQIGKGILVAANAVINPAGKIGNGVICNTSSVIDHECSVGDFTHIAPGAVLCGNVSIGRNCFIGANTVIREGVSICSNVVIGAGSIVLKNIVAPGTYFGSPVKKIPTKLTDEHL